MGDIRPLLKESSQPSKIEPINLLTIVNKASVNFLTVVSQRADLKALSYLLARMAQQQQRMHNTLLNISYGKTLRSKRLGDSDYDINAKLAEKVMQWYSDNQHREVNANIRAFVEDLLSNERDLLLLYRSSIREFKQHNLVNALASNIASIQMTFDTIRHMRFNSNEQ